jgi:hypothetical protein
MSERTVSSVISPAGTITQTTRGRSSCLISSASESAVDGTFGSYVLTSCPSRSSRSVIPEPIRPRPTIPSFIGPPVSHDRTVCRVP